MNSHAIRRGRAAIALVILAAVLTACGTWKPVEPPYRRALEHGGRAPVRVTLDDGRRLTLYRVSVGADSLIGYTELRPPSARTPVALTRVRRIQIHHTNTGQTLGGLFLILGGVTALVLIAWEAGGPTY